MLAPKVSVILFVDLSYQCYRAAAAHPMLTSGRFFTGGLYGFFATLGKTIRETGATRLVVCADVKPYFRSETYPEYKKLRALNRDEELVKRRDQSMKLIRETLDGLGVAIWEAPGLESDDLIALGVTRNRHRAGMLYAASNDSDLFQLLGIPNFAIYSKDIASVWTGARLKRELGLSPEQYMLATALQGTHNSVEGIAKVGEVTSRKAVKDPALMRGYQERHGALIERNLGLIKLPHSLAASTAPPMPTNDRAFDQREMYRLFGRYDIDVTMSLLNAMQQVLPAESRP